MFGNGGSVYWGRKKDEFNGIVLISSWVSVPHNQLKSYVDLYSSLGWNSLVSHADFLTAFDPDRALTLAFILLNELIEALRNRPCPVVFVAFSGGSKASMYKLLQVIQGTCEGHINMDESRFLRNCVSGHIYDSCPVDLTTDMGARFALQKMAGPAKLVSWFAKSVVASLDGLYLTRFESQRAEYWQTLYSSVDLGAPYLILCLESDHLAPYRSIYRFVRRLQHLGGDVELVKWNISSHVDHYKHDPIQYRAAVTNLLEKATYVYSQRIEQLREMSELVFNLQKAAVSSNQSLTRVAVGPSDHFFVPSSAESLKESGPLHDERKEKPGCVSTSPSINANSVLGKMLFDVCVPKNVEGWDIRFSGTLNGQPIGSARRFSPFRGMKFRRSRL